MLSYVAEEEAYDAICFIPNRDIKFAGFSVYQVYSPEMEQDFTCIYMIKIGNDKQPEKRVDFTVGEVDNKMVNIMFDA